MFSSPPINRCHPRTASRWPTAWYEDGLYELRVVGLDGTAPRVLYSNTEVNAYPTDWSPDGKSILTILERKDRTRQIVLVSSRDASVRR